MITYEALLCEISAIEAARNSLPSDTHIGALFDLTISRLREQAEAIIRSGKVSGGSVRPFIAVSDPPRLVLPLASAS